MTGTFWFKTIEELEASGWALRGNDYHHSHCRVPVLPLMLREMSGKQISVVNDMVSDNFLSPWVIRMEMVLSEDDLIDKILAKYSK